MNNDSELDGAEWLRRKLQRMMDSAGQLPVINRKEGKFDYLRETPAVHLGMGGYCYLAMDLLLELFPAAEVWRFTTPARDTFSHVFLIVDGYVVDIAGFRRMGDLLANTEFKGCIAEQTSVDAVRTYVRRVIYYEEDEERIVREVLSSFIQTHQNDFMKPPEV
jgi:hypothetical protein